MSSLEIVLSSCYQRSEKGHDSTFCSQKNLTKWVQNTSESSTHQTLVYNALEEHLKTCLSAGFLSMFFFKYTGCADWILPDFKQGCYWSCLETDCALSFLPHDYNYKCWSVELRLNLWKRPVPVWDCVSAEPMFGTYSSIGKRRCLGFKHIFHVEKSLLLKLRFPEFAMDGWMDKDR